MGNLREKSGTDTRLIKLQGPLNAGQAPKIASLFKDIAKQGTGQVVVNLEDVPLIDSRGLAALLGGYRLFGSDARRFRLAALQEQPKLLLKVCQLDTVLTEVEVVTA